MKRAGVRVYAAAEVPFLLAFGVPALLIGCVIGGVCVLVVLLCRQKAKRRRLPPGRTRRRTMPRKSRNKVRSEAEKGARGAFLYVIF